MIQKSFYVDSCIWRDHYENRRGQKGRPLGEYATNLFMKIIENQDTILFSDLIVKELKIAFDNKDVEDMLRIISLLKILKRVEIRQEDQIEAKKIANERGLPSGDVLHAILARNNNAILVSQDKHFQQLKDIVEVKKPEELL